MEHKLHKCDREHCYTCDGGLASCEVCGGAEGCLPTDCPGYALNEAQMDKITAGTLDFRGGEWVVKGWVPGTRLPRPLPKSGEADCPQCGSVASVARHNARWSCHLCSFAQVVDEDREAEREAAQGAIKHGKWEAQPLDYLIVATMTKKYPITPTVAIRRTRADGSIEALAEGIIDRGQAECIADRLNAVVDTVGEMHPLHLRQTVDAGIGIEVKIGADPNGCHDATMYLLASAGIKDGCRGGSSRWPLVKRAAGVYSIHAPMERAQLLMDHLYRAGLRPSEPEAPKVAPVATAANPYGYCPACGAPGVRRERRPDGNDECASGHRYASAKALIPPKSAEGTRAEGHRDKPSGVPVHDRKTE